MSSADPTTVEFEVTTVWKGRENRTIHLTTPRGESSCGFAFVEGVEYIVYSLNGFPVYLCSRTNRLSAAGADLAALGEGQVLGRVHPSQNREFPSEVRGAVGRRLTRRTCCSWG